MITCRTLVEFLDDYVNDRLGLLTRMRFRMHLLMCRECREYLDSYRQTMAMERDALGEQATEPVEPMPEAMVDAIVATLRAEGRTREDT